MKNEKENKAGKLSSYIGFAVRAGGATVGCDITVEMIRHGKISKVPAVVVISSDASQNTVKRAENACKYYEIPHVRVELTSQQLGKITGKAATSVVGVANKELAKAILSVTE